MSFFSRSGLRLLGLVVVVAGVLQRLGANDGRDLTLPAAERVRMRLHFVGCETCRDVTEQFDFLRRAMRQIDPGKQADELPKR